MFGQLGRDQDGECLRRLLVFLEREQEPDGSWLGRWGTNYIYGTWSVLAALEQVGDDSLAEVMGRGAAWLKTVQNDDGGWSADTPSMGSEIR